MAPGGMSPVSSAAQISAVLCVLLIVISMKSVSSHQQITSASAEDVTARGMKFSTRYLSFSSTVAAGLPAVHHHGGEHRAARQRARSPSPWGLLFLLLLTAGDVHVNPGPASLDDNICMYYQNCRSIVNKFDECAAHLNEFLNFDLLAFSETWLNNSTLDANIPFSQNFNIYRKDRASRGGGVLVAVNNNFPYKVHRRFDLEPNCELLWLQIDTPVKPTFLGCFYRKPGPDLTQLEICFDSVMHVSSLGNLIIAGDFNVHIKWNSPEYGVCQDEVDHYFYDHFVSVLGLKQFCLAGTRGAATLDIVLSSLESVNVQTGRSLFERADHDSLDVNFTCPRATARTPPPPARATPIWRRAVWADIQRVVEALTLDTLDLLSPNGALETFIGWLQEVIKHNVPHSIPKNKSFPFWYQADTILCLKNKYRAWQLKNQVNNIHTVNTFKVLRTHANYLVRRDYRQYVDSITDEVKTNPKRFFTLINTRKQSHRIPTELKWGDKCVSDSGRADIFNDYFNANFVPDNPDLLTPPVFPIVPDELNNISTFPVEISKIIDAIPTSRACGYDGLTAIFIKNCKNQLINGLCLIFNRCFEAGIFPISLKRAIVNPILKSGDKRDVTNYRPISILSILSYIYERIIYVRLMAHVQPFLSTAQHGFLHSRSCLSNLSVLQQAAIKAINAKFQLDIVHIDFQKAFDVVNHRLLLHKLKYRYKIGGKFLNIIDDFLHDREQRVVVGGAESEWSRVTSGVIQGSVLGPLLFVLYIDDLPDLLAEFDTECLLFADDSKVYKQVSTVRDCVQLQQAINCLITWCKSWALIPNLKKCGFLTISQKHEPIIFAYELISSPLAKFLNVNDLGVVFDSKLRFLDHITKIRSKGMQMLGILYRFRDIRDPAALKLYYTSIVLPIVEYCSPVWGMSAVSNLALLNRVQSFFARIVRGRVFTMRQFSTHQVLEQLGLQSLSERRHRSDLLFLYDLYHKRIACPSLSATLQRREPRRDTRLTAFFEVPRPRIEVERRCFLYRLPTLYNALPPDINLHCMRTEFKRLVTRHLSITHV